VQNNADVDLLLPSLGSESVRVDKEKLPYGNRVLTLPAIEPFGSGHASMWIRGLLNVADPNQYDFVHVAFEPWALIPQILCGRVPTVVHGAESVLKQAPLPLKIRRAGTTRVLKEVVGCLAWGHTSLDAFREAGLPEQTPQGVIPVGIPDPTRFTPTPIDESDGPLRVLFVGRLVEEKGLLTLVNAVCALTSPVILLVLGEGPLAPSLLKAVEGSPHVELKIEGRANVDQVVDAMAWSHIIVVPSQATSSWKEQWGRVAVEAMLSGRPTIVSNNGELPSLVQESQLVFSEGNVEQLAKILTKLSDNRDSLPEIGHQMHLAAGRFAPAVLNEELITFWDKILGTKETA
jgi:glycosyltransferase involved in cell wall biosynthesis